MGRHEADAFLNCVMRRSESDSLFRTWVVLAIAPLAPLATAFLLMNLEGESAKDMTLGIGLLSWTVTFYVLYLEVRGLNLHRRRDAEWMGALTAYARSYGRGSEEMDGFSGSSGRASDRSMAAFRAAFIVFLALNVSLVLWVRMTRVDVALEEAARALMPLAMAVEMSVAATYIFKTVLSHDSVQSRFTSLFVDEMGGTLGFRKPLRTSLTMSRIWPHVLLVVATFGLYSIVFNLVAVRKMNVHLTAQWAYEESLLAAIAKAEGATLVRRTGAQDRDTFRTLMDIVRRRTSIGGGREAVRRV